jgi:hypothetical protein
MPPAPQWILRLPDIRQEVAALNAPVIDRSVFEKIFSVRRRQAIHLMHRFGGYQIGRTFLIPTAALLDRLKALEGGDQFDRERHRKLRIATLLDEQRADLKAKHVRLEPPPLPPFGLPEGVVLESNRLIIHHTGATDLLQKLFNLAQKIGRDFENFEKHLEME